jgi:hypothetical protein
MATYYYTNGRPEEEDTGDHTTLFQTRPGVVAEKPGMSMKDAMRAITPPILWNAVKGMRK